MSTFQERVKLIRNLKNLSQKDFAQAIGVSRGYVSRLETQELNVEDRIYLLICSAFHIDESWLRTGEGDMYVKDTSTNDDTREVAEIYESLSPALRRCALAQLKALADVDLLLQD